MGSRSDAVDVRGNDRRTRLFLTSMRKSNHWIDGILQKMILRDNLKQSTKSAIFDVDFYSNLIETIQDGVCVLSAGQITLANQAFCDILGQDREQLVGQELAQHIVTKYLKLFDQTLHSSFDTENPPQEIELEFQHSTMSHRWIQVKIKPLVSKQNEVFDVLTLRDITSRKSLVRELELSEQYFKKIVDKLPSIYYRTNAAGILTKISAYSCEMMGYDMDELIGQPLANFYADPDQRAETLAKILANLGKPIAVESLLRRKNSSTFWVATSAYARTDEVGDFLGIEGMSIDITERKNIENNLREIAIKDQLTLLMNRFGLQEHLDQSLLRAKRQQSQISIIFIDLDKFKYINDTFGHQAGDYYLIEFGRRLLRSFRESDLVARIGGDEFVILLDDNTLSDSISKLLNRLQDIMQEPFVLNKKNVSFAYSFGNATYPKHGTTASNLLNYADQQMYLAKKKSQP